MREIMVSIYCLAYNHENYIDSALKGILTQKTNFRYEVIVHDDASQDRTAEIIHKYEREYPEIIKPVYQEKNQHSQGVDIIKEFIIPRAEGKYIGICEGDDYWVDEYKLQKQVDYLEQHPACAFCFTNAQIEDQADEERNRVFIPYTFEDRQLYTVGSRDFFLKDGQLSFAPTASYLLPKANYAQFPQSFWKRCPAEDLKLRLYSTALGYAHYIDEITCVYRENVPNSAMTKWRHEKRRDQYERAKKNVQMFVDLDEFTGKKYSNSLEKLKNIHVKSVVSFAPSLSVLKDESCKAYLRELPLRDKILACLKIMTPDMVMEWLKELRSAMDAKAQSE